MPWIIGGAAVGSALLSSNAAKKAGKGQEAAAQQAAQYAQAADNQARRDTAPYRTVGSSAVSRIGQLLGLPGYSTVDQNDPAYQGIVNRLQQERDAQHQAKFGMSVFDGRSYLSAPGERARFDDEIKNAATQEYLAQAGGGQGGGTVGDIMSMDPGYQFRLQEGEKALNNRLGAMGLRNSGAALKAGQQYTQDYASGEFGNIYNRLANTAGMGMGAVNTGVASGANTAGTIGNMLTGAANARGASAIGQANAYGGALNTVGSYYGQQRTLDQILNRGGYTGSVNPYVTNAPS